jgi:hypothetical protein
MEVAISKTQKRALNLLNIEAADNYEAARQALEAQGFRGDAIPDGRSWRDVAKMSDEQFVASLKDSMLPTAEEIADSVIEY